MADEENTQTQAPETQTTGEQQGPSEAQILHGIALNVIDNAFRSYGFNQPGTVQLDPRNIPNTSELDATATAAIEHGYREFVNEFLANPENLDLIYGPVREDGRRAGGNPELWYNSRSVDGQIHDFMLEPDGNYREVVLRRNQDGETVDQDATRALNHAGANPTRNLQHMNELSAQFWQNAFTAYAAKLNLPAELTATHEIDAALQQSRTDLRSALRTVSSETDPDALEELYNDITTNTYDQSALRARINPRPENAAAVNEITSMILQIHALETIHGIAATRDLTDYVVNGNLPTGAHMESPTMDRPWAINWNSREYTDQNGSFSWESASDFRTWDASVYQSVTNNSLRTDLPAFQNNEFAADYIAAQGWEGSMTREQFGALTRAVMINESAQRHGISDPFGEEAKDAFLQDYSEGYFHRHDLQFAFMAGQYARPDALNAAYQEQRHALDLTDRYPVDSLEFDSPRASINNDEWQSFFGRNVTIADASGGSLTVENATLTADEAVKYFFRMPQHRNSFGYDFDDQYDGYEMSYEELLARHGDEVSPSTGLTIAQSIQGIMSSVSSYTYHQMIYSKDGGPGDFAGDYERLYKARYSERLQERHLVEAGNMAAPQAPERDANAVTPQIERDNTPAPTPTSADPAQDHTDNMTVPHTRAELMEESATITVPPIQLASLMGGAELTQGAQQVRSMPRV